MCILPKVDSRDIIVIGASTGGYEAIERAVCYLPVTYPAAVFITIHVGRSGGALLTALFNRCRTLPAKIAMDGEALAQMCKLREYRCHTGHRYGLQSLLSQKASRLEIALNSALAQSEEMTALLESAISGEPAETLSAIHKEMSALREEQDLIRRLTSRRRDPTTIEE